MGKGTYGEETVDGGDAFLHAEDAEVGAGFPAFGVLGVDAAAVIADGDTERGVAEGEVDFDSGGAGVFFDVVEGFLRDAEDAGADRGGKIVGDVGVAESSDNGGAAGEILGEPLESGGEAEVIEEGGAKHEGDVPHGLDGGIDDIAGAFEAGVDVGYARGGGRFQAREFEAERGEGLADFVMEFARQAGAFGFLEGHQLVGEGLEVGLGAGEVVELPHGFRFGATDLPEADPGEGETGGEG